MNGTNDSRLRILKQNMNGASLKINQDPTATVDRPWNNVVVSLNAGTGGTIPYTVLQTAFATQVGSDSNTPTMEFRFKELRAWEVSGANLAATIRDLTSSTGADHRTQHDEPGRNHWSAVGLKWSNAQQQISKYGTDTGVFATIASSATAISAIVHVHVLWRFAGAPAPTVEATFN